jgi:hypothetical protein
MGMVLIFYLYTMISVLVNCHPVSHFWNISSPGYCGSPLVLWMSTAGLNAFADLTIIIIPMPSLSTLTLPMKQKILLLGVFALGAVYVQLSSFRSVC